MTGDSALVAVMKWLHARQGHSFTMMDKDSIADEVELRGKEPFDLFGDAEPDEYELVVFKRVEVCRITLRPSRLELLSEDEHELVLALGDHQLSLVDDGGAD